MENVYFIGPVLVVAVPNIFPRLLLSIRLAVSGFGVALIAAVGVTGLIRGMDIFLQFFAILAITGGKYGWDAFRHIEEGPGKTLMRDWWMVRYAVDPLFGFRYELKRLIPVEGVDGV